MTRFRSLLVSAFLIGIAATGVQAQQSGENQDLRVLPLVTQSFPPPDADPSAPVPEAPYRLTFHKSGRQFSCGYATYSAQLRVEFQPGLLNDVQFLDSVTNVRFDFADALPAGLHVERVHLSGDVLALPATIDQPQGSTASVTIAGIQFDPAAMTPTAAVLQFEVAIDARIDRDTFAVPALIDNQATLDISTPFGPYATMQSHDPAYPEDTDELSGIATSIDIDLSGCPEPVQVVAAAAGGSSSGSSGFATPGASAVVVGTTVAPGASTNMTPVPPAGGDACFELTLGELLCAGGGAYVFRMPVGPEMAGKTVSFASQTPGVWVDLPKQIVPVGGGTLDWTIYGAQPGMTLFFNVTGEDIYSGPDEGWGLCCTRLIEIVVPVADCPEPPPPNVVLNKAPVDCPPGATECTFRMTLTNPGPAPYTGPVAIVDKLTRGGARLARAPAAPWQCLSPTTPTACLHPATTLQPGESISLDLTLTGLTPEQWSEAVNCARLDLGLVDNVPPGSRLLSTSDCAYALVPEEPFEPEDEPPSLTLAKSATTPVCLPNGNCFFAIDIANTGGSTYSGPLGFRDTITPGASQNLRLDNALFDCGSAQPNEYSCQSRQDIVLPPGAVMTLTAMVTADPGSIAAAEKALGVSLTSLSNCAAFQDVPGMQGVPPESCAEIGLPPEPQDAVVVAPRPPPAPVRRAPAPPQPQLAAPRPPVAPPAVPAAPVRLQPRQPVPAQPQSADSAEPTAPVALVPRNPAPVSPNAAGSTDPTAPVALVPRSPAPAATQSQCAPTMVLNSEGRCACPDGTAYNLRKRTCEGAGIASPSVAPGQPQAPAVALQPRVPRPKPATAPKAAPKPKAKAKATAKPKPKAKAKAKPKPKKRKPRPSGPTVNPDDVNRLLNGLLGGGGGGGNGGDF